MSKTQTMAWILGAALLAGSAAQAQESQTPFALVRSVSNDLLVSIKTDKAFQSGNLDRLKELVDEQVMSHVDMTRLTSMAMGRYWRQASPAQQEQLRVEFKTLLVRSYAGVLAQVSSNQTIDIRPLRLNADGPEVVVSTFVRGQGEPIPIDYRLYRSGAEWKIYDVGIAGIWLAENYRNTFAQAISASGIDGLIARLQARNGSNVATAASK